LLEGAGAIVKIANNGRVAVETLSKGPQPPPFDVVLMDLQMPEMDGYQATAKLRSDSRFGTLPIIAMTAHATMEERQRCLAAGMNDHISKPIDPGMLFETLARFYKPAARSSSSSPAAAATSSSLPPATSPANDANPISNVSGLDSKDGLARVAGNRKLYLKLLRQFVEQQGPALDQVTAALTESDLPLAERLAHTLKGVAGNIGAKSVQNAAGSLEKAIRAKAPSTEINLAKQEVAAALDPLIRELRAALGSEVIDAPMPGTTGPVTLSDSREAAAQLAELLLQFDPAAADFIEANHAAVRSLFDDATAAQFEKLVQAYSFAEAQVQLDKALKNLRSA